MDERMDIMKGRAGGTYPAGSTLINLVNSGWARWDMLFFLP